MGCGPSIAGTNVQPALAECHYTLSHADSPRVLLSNDSAVGPTSSCCRAAACGSVTGSPIAPRPGGLSARSYEPVDPHGPSCPLAARGPPPGPPMPARKGSRMLVPGHPSRSPTRLGSHRPGKSRSLAALCTSATRFSSDGLGLLPSTAPLARLGTSRSHHDQRLTSHRTRPASFHTSGLPARHDTGRDEPTPAFLLSSRRPHLTPSMVIAPLCTAPLWGHRGARHLVPRRADFQVARARLAPLLTPSIPDPIGGNHPAMHGTPSGSPWPSALGPKACCLPGRTAPPLSSPHAVHT